MGCAEYLLIHRSCGFSKVGCTHESTYEDRQPESLLCLDHTAVFHEVINYVTKLAAYLSRLRFLFALEIVALRMILWFSSKSLPAKNSYYPGGASHNDY